MNEKELQDKVDKLEHTVSILSNGIERICIDYNFDDVCDSNCPFYKYGGCYFKPTPLEW